MSRVRAGTLLLAAFVAAVLGLAFLGALWTPHPPAAPVGAPWSRPGPGTPLGTDALGRDVWSRLLAGGAGLVTTALLAGLVATFLGTVAGLAAAWTRRAERLVRHVSAGLIAVPGVLVVLVCAMTLPGWLAVLAGMVLLGAPLSARVLHAAAVGLRRSGFVQAAIARGEPAWAVLCRELLPAVAGTVLADAGLRVVGALQLAVAVHVLGFGPAPPAADWALMLRENLPGAGLNPASVLAPAAALMLVAVTLTAGLDVLAGRLVPGLGAPTGSRRGRFPAGGSPAAPGHPAAAAGAAPAPVELRGVRLQEGDFTLVAERLTVADGETVALVGPSGAGKSTVLRLLLADLRPGLRLAGGELRVAGRPVVPGSAAARRWRHRSVGLLPQDPASTLDPLRRVEATVADGLTRRLPRRERRARIAEVLTRLGLPAEVAARAPHTLSGGQAGRVALARAVVGEPALLLADEPTSGLDPATAELVTAELARRRRPGMATVVVSHDRSWVAEVADRVLEVADGGLRPAGAAPEPRAGGARRPAGRPVLRVAQLTVAQPPGGAPLLAELDLTLRRGELVVVLGPSGAGKSTLLRTLCGLHPAESGRVWLDPGSGWQELATADPYRSRRSRAQRRAVALLGQDPAGELNPAHTLQSAVARPRRVLRGASAADARDHARRLLTEVGLPPGLGRHRPGGASGGQRQRAAAARALAADPAVLLADEPTSALDAVTATALLDLLDARRRDGLAVLLVTHDAAVAARADRTLEIPLAEQPVLRASATSQ